MIAHAIRAILLAMAIEATQAGFLASSATKRGSTVSGSDHHKDVNCVGKLPLATRARIVFFSRYSQSCFWKPDLVGYLSHIGPDLLPAYWLLALSAMSEMLSVSSPDYSPAVA
jgi:hypothetical protein